MKFENTKVFGLENAIIGMRLPMNLSFEEAYGKIDSDDFQMGEGDMTVALKLINADKSLFSQPNSKFLRMIHVQVCITAPNYWVAEADTYKVGCVRNSSSLMHKGMSRDYTIDDFEIDNVDDIKLELNSGCVKSVEGTYWQTLLNTLNWYRANYVKDKNPDMFRKLRQAIPMSYKYTFMFDTNYAALRSIVQQRKHHRLKEWSVDFINWCRTLPYPQLLDLEPLP